MKTNKLIFAMLLFSLFISAQPWEDKVYTHNGAFLSSAMITANYSINPGFLMAGYKKTSAANTPNFYVERTGPGGYYPASSSSYSFSSTYTICGQQNCSGFPAANNCIGVSVIEENVVGGGNYALAGAYSDGVFFSMLNASGVPVAASEIFWPFPANATSPTKPLIVGSTTQNEYFITGSYSVTGTGRLMYLLKVSGGGTFFASMNYNIAANMGMTPHGILMSPYGSVNEVVIIGEAYDTGGNGSFTNKGFFALFDTTSLNNNSCNVIGQMPGNPLPDDRFQSITVANNSGGYVIGGYTNMYPGAGGGNLWTLDVTSVGNIGAFNYVQRPSTFNNARGVVGITERYSSFFGIYMYYGVVETSGNNSMMAIRMDNTGNPFSATFPNVWNEFQYSSVGGNPSDGVSISFLDNGGANDLGFHVYGTDDAINGGRYLFVEATFSGDEGCSSFFNSMQIPNPGPTDVNSVGVNNLSSLTTCNNFSLTQNSLTPSFTSVCGSGTVLPTSGSLLKENTTTGITQNKAESRIFELYPNPTNEALHLNIKELNGNKLQIQISDCFGKIVKVYDFEQNTIPNKNELILNLKDLNLSNGIYFISTNQNGNRQNEKFIYCKE